METTVLDKELIVGEAFNEELASLPYGNRGYCTQKTF